MNKKSIVIFASGTGSNAREIINHFKHRNDVTIAGIVSNNEKAGVLDLAVLNNIDHLVIRKTDFYHSENILNWLSDKNCDLIVLAGFLWLIPSYLISSYPQQIINIHPALLPKYGGKGMYGRHVHQAVHDNKESHSGMTVHYVNKDYDEGSIIFQISRALSPSDSPDAIAAKVLVLEHYYYKEVVDNLLCR